MLPFAITSGEPAGIGPDICLALAQATLPVAIKIIGDRNLLRERATLLNIDIHALDIEHIPLGAPCTPGQLDVANAPYVLAQIDRAILGCQRQEYAAMITAPVHKGVINDAGIVFSGHTEYLAAKTGSAQVVMMLAATGAQAGLRVALVTTHLPLHAVAAAITRPHLLSVLRILHTDLRDKFGLAQPRILVAGLNPHAGESGHMGREEIEVITPVLNQLRAEGMNLIGPLPADTLFTPKVLADSDAQLAMYHDQGLAVLKYAAFDTGVNVTLGLPIIRTSVDHGTALDLAASGRASATSLIAAIEFAATLAAKHPQHKR